ncbi:site-specific DNA-methyltransferase [Candidatus Mycoplasma pogonae]
MNKTTAINIIENLDTTYLNQDQKRLAIKIINSFDEKEDLDALLSFILKRIKIGFTFDETFEVAEGYIALVNQSVDKNIYIKNNNLATEDENKLIIGENYEALKNLLLTYKEKIDIIYIDPPYNTESAAGDGNNLSSKEGQASKFIYKDKFGRNGWLNMMNERLQLAKKLLSEDGVIFVSIDDNEQAYLKVLMDEIFGEENFITNFVWQKKSGGGLSTQIYEGHEYVLAYSSQIRKKSLSEVNTKLSGFKKYLNKFNGKLILINDDILRKNFGKKINKNEHRNLAYEDLTEEKKKYWDLLIDNENYILVPFKAEPGKHLVAKIFKNDGTMKKIPYSIIKLPYTIISGIWTKDGNNEILETNLTFDNPKPIELIKYLIHLHPNKNATILDFFAGSGTTGHATLQLNSEDNGKRNFILVTNNENEIAEKVTYERLLTIINGRNTKGFETEWNIKNKNFENSKLRVFDIKHFNISIGKTTEKSIDEIKEIAISNLKLLNPSYNPQNLDIYYDLSGLNPYKKEKK